MEIVKLSPVDQVRQLFFSAVNMVWNASFWHLEKQTFLAVVGN